MEEVKYALMSKRRGKIVVKESLHEIARLAHIKNKSKYLDNGYYVVKIDKSKVFLDTKTLNQ